MKINFKNKIYIYHPDGKFTEEQLLELLEAAYKTGYNESKMIISYNQPWWYTTTPSITCKSSDNFNLNSTITASTANSTISVNNQPIKTLEFRYNGTEK